jgi:ATP-dependent DNA helicase RecG
MHCKVAYHIEAYDKLMDYIARHTLDRFFLMDDQRVSIRTWIARELVSNLLVHREYSKGFLARLIIEQDRIYAENWNRSNAHGRIDPSDFSPDAKNPLLAWFFVNIGRADYMGSGVRNLYKFTKIYSGGEPELIEGDVFKTIIPIAATSTPSGDVGDDIGDVGDDADNAAKIVRTLAAEPGATHARIAELTGLSTRTVSREIKALRDAGTIRRIGSDRAGHWVVIE